MSTFIIEIFTALLCTVMVLAAVSFHGNHGLTFEVFHD
jgi:hypothetical protein